MNHHVHPFLCALALVACTSSGRFEGDVTAPAPRAAPSSQPGPPAIRHDRVEFTWESHDGGISGTMRARLPDGREYDGHFEEITETTTVSRMGGFYSGWYYGTWGAPGYAWGGMWPYYGSAQDFITHYTGKVVALLAGSDGSRMRCHFQLTDGYEGMKAGGTGECQTSEGDRVTTWFGPGDGEPISRASPLREPVALR